LKTISDIRHTRSMPAIHRHALETALASHVVRARVQLNQWQAGVQQINNSRQERNPGKLMERLGSWQFANDDPVVQNALEDLRRWKYIEEQMPSVLERAVALKDIKTIESNLRELTEYGPAKTEWSRRARAMLKYYDSQATPLKQAIHTRSVEEIEILLEEWDFPEDAVFAEARAVLEMYDHQMNTLRGLLATQHVDASELAAVVQSWQFDGDCAEIKQAEEVLSQYQNECDGLEVILQEQPVNLIDLRVALDAWSFTMDSDDSGVLNEALASLGKHEVCEMRANGSVLQTLQEDVSGEEFPPPLGECEMDTMASDKQLDVELDRTSPGFAFDSAAAQHFPSPYTLDEFDQEEEDDGSEDESRRPSGNSSPDEREMAGGGQLRVAARDYSEFELDGTPNFPTSHGLDGFAQEEESSDEESPGPSRNSSPGECAMDIIASGRQPVLESRDYSEFESGGVGDKHLASSYRLDEFDQEDDEDDDFEDDDEEEEEEDTD